MSRYGYLFWLCPNKFYLQKYKVLRQNIQFSNISLLLLFSSFSLANSEYQANNVPMLEKLVNTTQNAGLRRGPPSLRNFDNIWTNIHKVMSDMNYGNC